MSLTAARRGSDDDPGDVQPTPHDAPPVSLARLLVDQVQAGASTEQARGFFLAAGRRLATARPLPLDCNLNEMMLAMNSVWRSVGLGDVSLEFRVDGIEADHRFGSPLADGPLGHQATAAFLEGCYGGWFHDIGGGERLRTRLLSQGEDRISIRYGL